MRFKKILIPRLTIFRSENCQQHCSRRMKMIAKNKIKSKFHKSKYENKLIYFFVQAEVIYILYTIFFLDLFRLKGDTELMI